MGETTAVETLVQMVGGRGGGLAEVEPQACPTASSSPNRRQGRTTYYRTYHTNSHSMYVFIYGRTYSKGMDQPGKVAN